MFGVGVEEELVCGYLVILRGGEQDARRALLERFLELGFM